MQTAASDGCRAAVWGQMAAILFFSKPGKRKEDHLIHSRECKYIGDIIYEDVEYVTGGGWEGFGCAHTFLNAGTESLYEACGSILGTPCAQAP